MSFVVDNIFHIFHPVYFTTVCICTRARPRNHFRLHILRFRNICHRRVGWSCHRSTNDDSQQVCSQCGLLPYPWFFHLADLRIRKLLFNMATCGRSLISSIKIINFIFCPIKKSYLLNEV